jgi:hypothetical protein
LGGKINQNLKKIYWSINFLENIRVPLLRSPIFSTARERLRSAIIDNQYFIVRVRNKPYKKKLGR